MRGLDDVGIAWMMDIIILLLLLYNNHGSFEQLFILDVTCLWWAVLSAILSCSFTVNNIKVYNCLKTIKCVNIM